MRPEGLEIGPPGRGGQDVADTGGAEPGLRLPFRPIKADEERPARPAASAVTAC